jgi:hypothetical protein
MYERGACIVTAVVETSAVPGREPDLTSFLLEFSRRPDGDPWSPPTDPAGSESAVWRLFDAAAGATNLSVAERTDAVTICRPSKSEAHRTLSQLKQ